MSRPAAAAALPDAPREWYPLGRLLVHLAVAVAIGVVLVGILIGFNRETMTPEITQALVQLFSAVQSTGTPPTAAEIKPFVHFYLAIMPFSVTAILVFILTFDLWLAAVVARASGRLQRPRETMWSVVLPNRMLVALAGLVLLAFLPGAAGEIARVFAGALAGAAALAGLAVMHALTAGMGGRTTLLIVVYMLIIFSGLPLILFALLAVAEALFHLRARRFKGVPPQ
jgi:large-conductance mechanosensitive channel